MTDNSTPKTNGKLGQSLKAFSNLLKEFPKNPSDDFIYDESTIKKIMVARETLPFLNQHFKKAKAESIQVLNQLMEELPKDASDEFLYDRDIHQLVEKSRKIINLLS